MAVNSVDIKLSLSVDSSSEEEVGQATKLSQFLKPPSPGRGRSDRDMSTGARIEDKSDHNERDKRSEHRSDREHASTRQRLLALAEYGDEPSNDRDTHDSSRHSRHKSTHQPKLKNSRSPGHRRH